MIPHGMSIFNYLFQNIGIMVNISPETKKGRLGIVLFEMIQHPGSDIGCRTIIKSQEDLIFFTREAPV
jgi:hypothetical protein